MTSAAEIAATAGPGVGAGIGTWAGLKFIRWLVEFIFARLDVRRSDIGKRVQHLEIDLDNVREAMMILFNALATQDPKNPALIDAVVRLRKTPRVTLELDELEKRLREEVE